MNDPLVVAAAEPYVRVQVRVPEAYLLLPWFETTRPGLLVLDADGHRVASIPLPGMGAPKIEPAEIARRLGVATKTPSVPVLRAKLTGAPAAIQKLRAATGGAIRKGKLVVTGKAASPERLLKLAKEQGVEATMLEPVEVALDDQRIFVSRFLLDPESLPGAHLETRTFELPGVPKDGAGCKVALAPLDVPGVVTIFPDIFGETELVIARPGVDWNAVEKALAKR